MPALRRPVLLPLLLAACAAQALAAADGTPVPVANGGFEAGASGWENGAVVDGTEKHGGAKALVLAKGFTFQSPGAMVPVEPGSDYRVTLWVKTAGCAEATAAVCAGFRAAAGGDLLGGWIEGSAPVYAMDGGRSPVLAAFGGTGDWRPVTVGIPAVQIPTKARFLHLYLRHDLRPDPGGTVWFDDLAVERRPGGTLPVAVVRNGDFARGKDGWWGEGAWDVADDGTGGRALTLSKGFACQDRCPVSERRNYRISMRVRSTGCAEGAVFVQTGYRNGDQPIGSWHGPLRVKLPWGSEAAVAVDGGDHPWRELSIVVQAPPTATRLLLYLRKQDGPGTAWFDDVRVEPTDEKPYTVADRRAAELAAELLAPADGAPAQARLAAAAAAGKGATPEQLVLAADGALRLHLHVGDDADLATLGALRELRDLLGRITGTTVPPAAHDAAPADGPLLVIGRGNALTAALCPDVDWDALGADGFIIRSVGPHLIISGANGHGTMNGVNWFLDRVLGVRWPAPGITHVPSAPSLAIPAQRVRQVPRFAYREVLSDEGSDATFAAHNLLNGRSHGPSFAPTAPELETWDHSWMAAGGSANFLELLPQKTYGKAHPEWYSGGQVAMMDAGMRAAMAKEVIARLKAHPDYRGIWFNIWQMDWGWDLDPASRAFANAHGGHASAPRLDMMIDIAAQVRAELPGARLAFNAYTWGFTPPTGMTVPDHILVFPMTLHVDYKSPLNAGRNEQLAADMVGWTRIARNVIVWDHIANWAGFIQPTPNILPIGDSIRWLSGVAGVRGYFCEGNWNSPGGEFGALRAWLIARLTWDPTLDPKALIGEWCALVYGPAAEPVRRYIDLMHQIGGRTDDVLGQRYMPDLKMYDVAFISAADALFDQAEAAVAGDAERLKHVRQARMPIDHLALLRRAEYGAAATAAGLPWQVDAAARRARFDQGLVDNRVREYRQGGSVKELGAMLDVERVPSGAQAWADPLLAARAAADRVEIQDLAFMRFDRAAIMTDPAATDHAAIRTSGTNSVWSIQLPLGALPKEGDWDLYAAVRIEAETGHDDEPGVRVGSAPPMGLFTTATIGALRDGAYHLVPVPGGPHRWAPNNPLRSFYIQSPAKPYITYIWVDRFVALRHQP